MQAKIHSFIRFLGSSWMFAATLLLFSVESGWLALTSRFPGAFDEAYHFGLIQVFSHRLSPIIFHQTSATYKYGALIFNPSLLYHYLLSFPYRLIAVFAHDPMLQVICLRFINIALVVAALVLARRLLHLLRLSPPLSNLILFVFALTPLITILAAQINYDNLLILAVMACLYQAVLLWRRLEKDMLDVPRLLLLVGLCCFSSLIKYAFLPVFLALLLVIGWKITTRPLLQLNASARLKLPVVVFAAVGLSLFAWYYGGNTIKYHNPVPQCDQVLTVNACKHYYAWHHIYVIQADSKAHHQVADKGLVLYGLYWTAANTFELFGVQVPLQGHLFAPLPFFMTVILLGTAMTAITILQARRLLRKESALQILVAVSLIYLVCLLAKNYHDYVRAGQTVALHGRYLSPILICIYVLLACGLREALKTTKKTTSNALKVVLALTVIVAFLCYGGFRQYVTYIDPVYGRLSHTNHFVLDDAAP